MIRYFISCILPQRFVCFVASAEPNIRFAVVAILLFSLCCCNDLPAAESTGQAVYSVGVAKRDVTPEYPVRLNGFAFRKAESEGVSQALWARALAIGTDEQSPVVLVTLDSLGIRSAMVDEVHRRLAEQTKLERDHLIMTFTHTHSAPKVNGASDNIFAEPIPAEHQVRLDRYTEELTVALADVIQAALADRQPATLGWTVGEVGFAANRRTKGGPVDHSLPCLIVRAANDPAKVRAIYTTYACHCVTLSQNMLSGDWAGYAVESIERHFPGAIGLVSIGCGADQNPDSGVTGDKVDIAQQQGMQIGDEVARLIKEGTVTPLSAPVQTAASSLQLPFQTIPTREQFKAMEKQGGPNGYNATTQLARMDRGEKLPESLSYPIQVCYFGDQLCMVFLSGEVCVDYSLRLKKELDAKRLWMHGYSHDFGSYIPSERLLSEGGYGAGAEIPYFALPNKLAPGLEKKIIDKVHRLTPPAFTTAAPQPSHGDKPDDKPLGGTNGIPPTSPEQSLQKFETDADLKVQLVASEPQIVDPVAIDFGPDGDVWVVQMTDYGRGIEEEFVPQGEVRVLKDNDGDGHYETSQVFIGGLRYPTDVKVWRDGALICDAPNIIFARDQDGDGKAESREILFSGFATHNGQARVNSLRWGLDNWLYGSGGLFGGQIANQEGKVVDVSGRDFRIQPDLGLIEPVTGRSQQGRTRDDFGNWFGCTNSNLIYHYPVVDHYVKRNPFVIPPATSISVPSGENAGKLFPSSDLVLFRLSGAPGRATAACGVGIYRDDHLGPAYHGNSFTCEPVNQLVYRQVLERKGATIRGTRAANEQNSEFLRSSDRWFRPVQARTGPDGGLWVVDMYRYVIEHPKWIPDETLAELDVFAGKGLGRIYRVLPTKMERQAPLSLSALNDQDLAKAIDSNNGIVRDLVHQMLLWRDAKSASEPLRRIAKASKNPAVRIQALAALDGLNELSTKDLWSPLADSSSEVRRHAVRLAEKFLADPKIAEAVLPLANDEAYEVRLQVANSIAALESDSVTAPLTKLATESNDPYMQSAALSSLTASNVGPVAEQVLESEPARLQIGEQLIATTAGLGSEKAIHSILNQVLRSSGDWHLWQMESFAQLLDGLDRRASSGSLAVVDTGEKAADSDDQSPTVSIQFSADQKQAAQAIFLAALDLIDKADVPDNQIEMALKLLGRKSGPASQNLISLTDLQSASDQPLKITNQIAELIDLQYSQNRQLSAVRAITRRGEPAGGEALLQGLESATPQVRTSVVQALIGHPAWDPAILSGLQAGILHANDFNTDHRQQFIERQPEEAREQTQKWFGKESGSDREALVSDWSDISQLQVDPTKGKALFAKHCSACHQFNGVGHKVGPDLAALTSRSHQFLLTAILNPNRDVDARFQNYTALMDDGRVVSGQIVSETATSVTLLGQEAKQEVLLRNQLEVLRATGKSAMPEGLEKDISKQEMADIMSYVQGADSEAYPLARKLIDDSLAQDERLEIVAKWPQYSAQMITALTADMPDDMEEQYRRIPWIWRLAIAAGKRNESKEILEILDVSLPQPQQPLMDWQAVVIGGGLVNGISQTGSWPLDRIQRLISGNGPLVGRWSQAIQQASVMSDNPQVRSGTRYDALRMIALAPWATHGQQLASYLGDSNAELQMGAVSGLSDMPAAEAGQAILQALPKLQANNRELALDAMLRTVPRIERLLAAIEAESLQKDWLGEERLATLLKHENAKVRQQANRLLSEKK
ncbi:Cytochrome c [Roseimaritima multifibrata]|uniref:Cytochrome c n=1 Tax=Roseimaritima multifibrata TaxID=1930274 RepID=A0A517MHT5_9BACT|nr:Cytochrome c [Roseimaritima multifibrata]